jgi:hypothetical protein
MVGRDGQRHANVVEVPSLPQLFDDRFSLLIVDAESIEIKLRPKQDVQIIALRLVATSQTKSIRL